MWDVRRCQMWEDVRRCQMWEDVRCEKMWEDVRCEKMSDVRRCEKMSDVRRCQMWEDVRRCEKMSDVSRCQMWEDVRRCEKMSDVRRCQMWEDVRRCQMWEVVRRYHMWEDLLYVDLFTPPSFWKTLRSDALGKNTSLKKKNTASPPQQLWETSCIVSLRAERNCTSDFRRSMTSGASGRFSSARLWRGFWRHLAVKSEG